MGTWCAVVCEECVCMRLYKWPGLEAYLLILITNRNMCPDAIRCGKVLLNLIKQACCHLHSSL